MRLLSELYRVHDKAGGQSLPRQGMHRQDATTLVPSGSLSRQIGQQSLVEADWLLSAWTKAELSLGTVIQVLLLELQHEAHFYNSIWREL